MPRQIKQKKIIDAVIEGMEEAHIFYEECSGGYWLCKAPEYLLSSQIAKGLYNLDGAKYVTLESNVHSTLKDADASSIGALKKTLRKNGRFDVVLWWGDGSPRAAIEVKNRVWSFTKIRKDVKRIEGVLEQNKDMSSFQFGLIAFYSSSTDNKRTSAHGQLDRLLQTLHIRAREHVHECINVEMVRGDIHVVDDSAWAATCIVLKS